jgi:23S rRNA pseudouridine2605 synthase
MTREAELERLHKVLAGRGVASRRAAERLIEQGRVRVNGTVITRQGTKVDPRHDVIAVDGRRLAAAPAQRTYLMVHKPRGFVTTLSDPEGRPTVLDLLRGVGRRVFPVGRLDFDSEGLLLVTDDGSLARELMHPGNGVPRTYRVQARGEPGPDVLARLTRGVRLDGRKTQPAKVQVVPGGRWIEITLTEGRNRQVRRMFEAVGHPVKRLRRVSYGGVHLGRLPKGTLRALTPPEVALLRGWVRR